MDIPPYLSRELSKFDEIWYTNANFDDETWQIWNQYKKSKYNINFIKTTKFMSNDAISKLKLKKQQKITFLF